MSYNQNTPQEYHGSRESYWEQSVCILGEINMSLRNIKTILIDIGSFNWLWDVIAQVVYNSMLADPNYPSFQT